MQWRNWLDGLRTLTSTTRRKATRRGRKSQQRQRWISQQFNVSPMTERLEDRSLLTGTVEFASATFAVAEDAGTSMVVSLSRTGTTVGTASVDVSFSNGTAGSSDYTSTTVTVNFANGDSSATVAIPITEDVLLEGTEKFTATVSQNADVGTSIGTQNTTEVSINDNESATLAIAATSSATEAGGAQAVGVVTLTITGTGTGTFALGAGVSLTADVTDAGGGTATGGGTDYNAFGTQSISFDNSAGADGDIETADFRNTSLTTVEDVLLEGSETVNLSLSNLGGSAVSVSPGNASNVTTITDNESATLNIAATSSATEAGGAQTVGVVTLTITGTGTGTFALGTGVSITADVTDAGGGSATGSGTDYNTFGTQTVTFNGGVATGTTKNTTLTVVEDVLLEGSETVNLSLGNLAGSAVSKSLGTTSNVTTISDNESATLDIAATSSATEAGAGQSVGVVTLTITGTGTGTFALGTGISITADVTDAGGGTATGGGTDYDAFGTQTVTFNGGAATGTTKNTTLTVVEDVLLEGSETVNLSLGNLAGSAVSKSLGTTSNVTTISDNESATLAIAATSSATEAGGAQTVGVVTLTITGTGIGTFALGTGISITADVTDAGGGSATGGGTDYDAFGTQTVTFNGGAATGTTKNTTLTVVEDVLLEGSETVNLSLGNLGGSSVTKSLGNTSNVTTISDNESATLDIAATSSVTEAGGAQTVGVVTLTIAGVGTGTFALGPGISITADVTDAGTGTATGSGTDYNTFGTQTVTFNGGAATGTTKNTTLTVVEDVLLEGSETVNLSLGNLGGSSVTKSLGTTSNVTTISDNESATLDIAATSSATEAGGGQSVGVVTLTITGTGTGTFALGTGISITADITDAGTGSATSGSDYSSFGTQTVTFNGGAATGTTKNATLTVTNDTLLETSETVNLSLGNIGGSSVSKSLGATANVTTISDNESATLAIAATSSATEAGGAQTVGVVTLTITGSGTGTFALGTGISITADVTDAGGGSATGGSTDYDAFGTQTVTFDSGAATGTTKNTTLTVVEDVLLEGSETVNLSLGNLAGSSVSKSLGNTSNVTTISDNESATLAIAATSSVTEAGGAQTVGVVTLTITGTGTGTFALGTGVSITADVTDAGGGSATGSGTDYNTFGTQTVTFNGGAATGTTQNTSLTTVEDVLLEGSETVNLSLGNLGGSSVSKSFGNTSNVTTISDNESATLDIAATSSVTEAGGAQTVGVVTLTITGTGTGTFALGTGITITADVTDAGGGSATSGSDYSTFGTQTVTFNGGASTGTTKNTTLTVTDDTLLETSETVNLSLGNLGGSTVSKALGATSNVTTISDNESATLAIAATSTATEAGGAQSVGVVTLTITGSGTGTFALGAGISLTADITDAGGGSAIGGSTDYDDVGTQTVTFNGGAATGTTKSATVTITNDQRVEGSETFNLSLGNLGGSAVSKSLGNTSNVTTITDNDTATYQFTATSSSVNEDNTTKAVNVTLSLSTNGTGTVGLDRSVTIPVVRTGGTANVGMTEPDAAYTTTNLMFATGDGTSFNQDVTVTVYEDIEDDDNETVILGFGTITDNTGGQVSLGTNTAHTVTILDDDTPAAAFDVPSGGAVTVSTTAGGNIEVYVNGVLQSSTPIAGITSLTINGTNGGDETLTLDFTNNPIPSGGIVFNGGTGGNDAIVLQNGSFTSVAYSFTNETDGSISLDGKNVTYTGLDPITANITAATVQLDFSNATETIDFTVNGAQTDVNSNVGGETLTFTNPTTSLIVNTGDGDNTVNFTSFGAGFNASVNVTGGSGVDTVTFADLGAAFASSITVDGAGGASDVVNLNDTGLTASSLNLTAETIAQTAAVTVTGTTTLVATTAGTITLTQANNDFQGNVNVTSANNASFVDSTSITLGAVATNNNLTVDATSIVIAGAVTVTGVADLDASTTGITDSTGTISVTGNTVLDAATTIVLDGANNFSTVDVTSATGVTLNDTNGIVLDAVTTSGALVVDATSIDLTGTVSAGSADLDASSGSISDSAGKISVTGTTALEAGTTITLDDAANDFQDTVTITSATSATLVDANTLKLGAITISGALDLDAADIDLTGTVSAGTTIDVDATASLSQSGAITSGTNLDYDAGTTISITAGISVSGTVDIDSTGTTTIGAAGDINAGGAVTFGASKAGTLTTSGDIDTSDDSVTFTNAVTLGGNVDVDTTGAAAGSILFSSTIATAGFNLALDAGPAGNVTLSAALSGGGDMTVRDGAVQSYQALTVNSLNIQDATTSVTFNAAIAATTTIDVDSQGGSITQSAAVTTATNLDYDAGTTISITAAITTSGTVDIDSTGTTTIGGAGDINAGGAVTFGAAKAGTLTTSGDVDTSDDNVTFTRAVTLGASIDVDTTGAAAGNILFSSTIATAGFNLALDAGTAGNVTLSAALTGGGDTTVRDGAVQSYQALTVNSLNIQDATTSVTFNGAIAATTTIDVDAQTGSITQSGAVTSGTNLDYDAGTTIGITASITVSGTVDIDSTGTTTIGANGDINAGGAVTFGAAKAGTLTTSGDVDTTDDNVTFTNAVTLGGAVDIDTTGTAAGNILFSSTIATANNNLSLDAGPQGDVTLSAALSGGGNLVVRDGDVQSYQGIAATSVDIQDATTSVTFSAAVSVTANNATGGNALKVNTDPATVTINGTITATAAAGLNIDIDPVDVNVNANMTATGDIDITASNDILVAAVTVRADSDGAGGGTLTITADNDASDAGNLTANTASTLRGHTVMLSGENVTVGIVTADVGDVTVNADNEITFNGVVTATTAQVVATAADDDLNINANISAGTNVDLQATTGTIEHATAANILAGTSVFMDAGTAIDIDGTIGTGTAIGSNVSIATAINTPSVTIDGNITANGAVTIGGANLTGSVTIGGAAATVITSDNNAAGAEDITIRADGAISQATGGSSLVSNTGGVAVRSDGSTVTLISVDSNGANQLASPTAANTGLAAITIQASTQVTVSGINSAGGNGAVDIVSDTDGIALNDVDAGAGNVYLEATNATNGDVTDANAAALNITANLLNIAAGAGVGTAADALDTSVSTLVLTNSTNGDVNLLESDAITVRQLSQNGATGKVTLTTTNGTITIEDAQTGVSSLAGNIVIDANGATSDIANNHTITSTSGLITLTADNTITFDGTSSISSTSGNVSMTADADADNDGAITMTDGSFVNSGTGTITAAAADDITLARFVTTNNTATAVSITSGTGGLIDGGDTNTDNIEATGAAATVTITTATGIGSATPVGGAASHAIETEISRLVASVLGAGGIDINELDAINLLDIDTANGRITVDAGGTITATDVVSTTDSNANDIALRTTAGGIIVTLINAGTTNGDVILQAQTSITESAANTTTKITADGLLLSASGGSVGAESGTVGTAQDANLLDLAVNRLEASVAGGGLFVVNTQALILEDTDLTTAGNDGIDRDNDGGATAVTSTGGTVRVNTTAGSLTIQELVNAATQLATFNAVGIFSNGDGNSAASDVNAASVAFRSTAGVGTMADSLEINATSGTNGLAFFNGTAGDVFIRDVAGGLVIDNVDTLTNSQNTAAVISVIALSPLTVSHDVIATGAITLTATDSAGSGDDLLVTTPTRIDSNTSVITIRGGDNVTFEDHTELEAAGTITVEGDFGNADAGVGSTITFNGIVDSTALTTVLGNSDPDFIRVFPTSPDVLDTDTTSKMKLDGAGDADQYFLHTGGLNGGAVAQDVTIDDSGSSGIDRATVYGSSATDGTKATPVVVHNNVTNGMTQTGGFVTYPTRSETVDYTTTLERLEVRGDEVTGGSALPPATFDEVDYFDVQPSQSTRILIHGNDPQFGDVTRVPDGDVLDVDPFNNTFTIIGTTIFTDGGSPSPFLGVTFRNIESVPLDPIGTDTQKYDFDYFNDSTGTSSPLYPGYTSVLNSTFYGVGGSKFGFVPLDPADPFGSTALNDVDDGSISSPFSDLVRDGLISTVPQTFKTDIANGWYLVSVKVTNTPGFSVVDADANFTIISGKDITGHGELNFVTQVKDGSLDLKFSGLEVWRIDGLEIRPGHILTEGSPETNPLAADGATIDTFTGYEGTPGALITVSGGLDINGDDIPDVALEVTSTDVDPDLAGVQVLVGGDGQWDYSIRRPALAGTAYVNFAEFDGAQTGATAIDYIGPMSRRFDFGRGDLTGAAALAAIQTPRNGFPAVVGVTEPGGYINVTPGDTNLNASGYGWAHAPKVSDYPSVVSGSTAALLRDQHQGDGGTQGINTFSTQVANGTYYITATVGHAIGHVAGMLIRGEGNDLFGSITTQPGQFLTLTNAVPITVVDGVLDLQFESTTHELWSIAGLEVRAVSLVTGGVTILTHLGTATADGTTVDTITGSSAPNAILTVSSTLGTITSADISSIYGGTQIQASAAGVWSFTLKRPTVPGAPTISVVAADGSGSASDSTVITYQLNGATPTLFDFNIQSSPTTQSGFTGVITDNTYSADLGYGWVGSAPSSFSQAAGASTIAALIRDGAVSSGSGTPAGTATHTFRADLAPGNYEVTVIYGSDSIASGDTITVNGAGAPSITGLSSAAGQHTQRTFTASTMSLGGRDTITVGFGSADATPWTINGIIFRKVSTVPVLSVVPQATPVTADGTSVDTFSVSGLSVGQVYTVTTTSGTVTTVDADPQMAGVQFVAGAATATFMIQRPATAGTATIAVEHITGNGRGATTQGYQIATSRRFDFDTASSPTAAGFTSVTPQTFFNTTTGYGWTDYIPNAYDRAAATGTTTTALYRDGVHAQDLTFKVAVDDLTAYSVRVYFGDEFVPTQGVITVEGAAAPVTTAYLNPQQFGSQVVSGGTDANHDGFITIRLQVNSVAPTQAFFVSGLDIAQTLIGLPTAAPLTASSIGSGGSSIAAGDLTAIVSAAITRYEELGLGGAALNHLKSVQFRVQDLGGATLGLGGTGVVVIDDDAAGHGWFVDSTPADDSEFASGSNGVAAGKVDLLTAVMHELGHELGLDDIAGSSDLMGDVIGTGIRRTADLDAVFAANNFWGE